MEKGVDIPEEAMISGWRIGCGIRRRTDFEGIYFHRAGDGVGEHSGAAVEAELDNPSGQTNREVVSLMFDAVRDMVEEARGENERTLFSQGALNERYRELDEREIRLDARDERLGAREAVTAEHAATLGRREEEADTREREQMEREVHAERGD